MATKDQGNNTTGNTVFRTIGRWAEDPMASVVAATGAIFGSFAFVLSGIWVVQLAVQ